MRWWADECKPGDIVRIHLGSVYHYGIFVSESEVIQYGLPPLKENIECKLTAVCATGIDEFSCGKIVEVAHLDKKEKKESFSQDEIIAKARARIGEDNYNIIHNNCEHFVNECVFGKRFSQQETDALNRWKKRPVVDVYIYKIPEQCEIKAVVDKKRNSEINATNNQQLKKQKYAGWRNLVQAIEWSFNTAEDKLEFKKDLFGKWSCKTCQFSISNCDDLSVVAVSNEPVGIDVENINSFSSRFGNDDKMLQSMRKKICCDSELQCSEELISLWVKKESIFKAYGKGSFHPVKYECDKYSVRTYDYADGKYLMSVCSPKSDNVKFYLNEDDIRRLISIPEKK